MKASDLTTSEKLDAIGAWMNEARATISELTAELARLRGVLDEARAKALLHRDQVDDEEGQYDLFDQAVELLAILDKANEWSDHDRLD